MFTTTIQAVYLGAALTSLLSYLYIVGENSATCETVLTGPRRSSHSSAAARCSAREELREKTREEVSTRPVATRQGWRRRTGKGGG